MLHKDSLISSNSGQKLIYIIKQFIVCTSEGFLLQKENIICWQNVIVLSIIQYTLYIQHKSNKYKINFFCNWIFSTF